MANMLGIFNFNIQVSWKTVILALFFWDKVFAGDIKIHKWSSSIISLIPCQMSTDSYGLT